MSNIPIFIDCNGVNHIFWVNFKTRLSVLMRDVCLKFNLPHKVEYDITCIDKIRSIITPFYLLCNSKILDRCTFKNINEFNTCWPKYEITKESTIRVHLLRNSKLWKK